MLELEREKTRTLLEEKRVLENELKELERFHIDQEKCCKVRGLWVPFIYSEKEMPLSISTVTYTFLLSFIKSY